MLLTAEFFEPRELTGFGRQALFRLPENQPSLARWLPNMLVDDLESRFTKGGDALVSATPYRSFDAEASITGRPGLTRSTVSLPPLSEKVILGEYDRLRMKANPTEAIRTAIMEDAERVVKQVDMRLELARADALMNGSVTIDENGIKGATVDYGRDSLNEVSASPLWSNLTTSDPIRDMRTWASYYRTKNGVRPGVQLMSESTLSYLLENETIRTLASNIAGTPSIVDEATLTTVLNRWGLPPIEVYEVQYNSSRDPNNVTATPVLDPDMVLFLPAPSDPNSVNGGPLGGTFYGTTAESGDPRYGLIGGGEAGVVVGNYSQDDPYGVWTKASGLALPVLVNPDMSLRATVA
jgi:hypothetical protein